MYNISMRKLNTIDISGKNPQFSDSFQKLHPDQCSTLASVLTQVKWMLLFYAKSWILFKIKESLHGIFFWFWAHNITSLQFALAGRFLKSTEEVSLSPPLIFCFVWNCPFHNKPWEKPLNFLWRNLDTQINKLIDIKITLRKMLDKALREEIDISKISKISKTV